MGEAPVSLAVVDPAGFAIVTLNRPQAMNDLSSASGVQSRGEP